MGDEIQVSVITITYNQSKYLKRALDSILSQKTDFQYELIVHDDVSTDSTIDILRDYEKRYPDIIRVIYETENQYSQGVDFVANMIQNKAKGKYIAFCEGDDFWIDDNKLQLQYETLETHPECDMCSCWGCTVTEDTEEEVSQIRPREINGILPVEEVIAGGGQFLVTAGLFFRKDMYDKMLPFEKIIPLDYAQQIKGALRGGIWYIDKKMAVYRRYSDGSWTNDVLSDDEKLQKQWEKEKALLRQLDEDTEYKYHDTIEKRLSTYITFKSQLVEHTEDIKKLLMNNPGNMFIWGMGRRGKSLENFFYDNDIPIIGVCDASNQNIGGKTKFGNPIFATDYVMANADVISASTLWAYKDLVQSEFKGKLLDFQQFMPIG